MKEETHQFEQQKDDLNSYFSKMLGNLDHGGLQQKEEVNPYLQDFSAAGTLERKDEALIPDYTKLYSDGTNLN